MTAAYHAAQQRILSILYLPGVCNHIFLDPLLLPIGLGLARPGGRNFCACCARTAS